MIHVRREEYIGTCFDTIYTNFKFNPCVNFDPEFLELPKGAIVHVHEREANHSIYTCTDLGASISPDRTYDWMAFKGRLRDVCTTKCDLWNKQFV